MSSSSFVRSFQTTIATLTLLAAVGCSQEVSSQDPVGASTEALKKGAPVIPAAIAIPAGNRLAFRWRGEGVQIYVCTASSTATGTNTYAWVFKAPDANLYNERHLVGAHYAGPTWEALDGSTVVGTKLSAATVDASAIPWLLLQAASHSGAGRMTDVTFIQRLDTTGGLAPTAGCDADHVAAVANVDYTANYYFYEAEHDCKKHS